MDGRIHEGSATADDATHANKHNDDGHADDEDDTHHEPTEGEKDMMAVRCLRIFNVFLLIVGGALTGLALWGGRVAIGGFGSSLPFAVAGIGASICLMTIVGLIGAMTRWTTPLVLFYTWLIILAFGMLLLGGLCFVFSDMAVSYMRANWSTLSAQLPASERTTAALATLSNSLKLALYGVGGLCILLLLMVLGAVSSVIRLVTPLRAYTLLLQSNNVTLLPVAVGLIAIATYVADTAAGVEAPILAYGVFVLGMTTLSLVLIGCTGATLRARGILNFFMILTFVLMLAFLAFGVSSFAVSQKVADYIVSQWASLRRVLPAGFSGKYDKDQFSGFVTTNLTALGFFAVCTGTLLFVQSWGSFRLNHEINREADLEKEALEALSAGLISKEDADALHSMRSATSPMEVCWKRSWTHGTRLTKCCVILAFLLVISVFIVIVGVATAALYYQTTCQSLDLYAEVKSYDAYADIGPYFVVNNSVSRGSLKLTVDTKASDSGVKLTLRKSAFKPEFAMPGWPTLVNTTRTSSLDVLGTGGAINAAGQYTFSTLSLTVTQLPPSKILGVDTSCQASDVTMVLPRAGLRGGNNRTQADSMPLAFSLNAGGTMNGIEADWSAIEKADRPRIRRLDLSSGEGPIEMSGVYVGSKGMSAFSDNGTVVMDNVDVQCDPNDAGVAAGLGGVLLMTTNGGVEVKRTAMYNCDVTISSVAASSALSNSVIRSARGGSRTLISSSRGAVDVDNTVVEVLDMKGDEGAVRVTNATIMDSMRASTGAGKITLSSLRMGPRATLQVETETGDITVWASEFSGIVSVVTGGTISCIAPAGSKTGFVGEKPCEGTALSTETASDGTVITILERVNVNCVDSCPYMGGVSITSARGAVTLRFDKWAIAV